jgi:hypothetical protein
LDLWILPNPLIFIIVVIHYLNKKAWRNYSKLLELRRLHNSHSGEIIASFLIKLFNEYEITNRLEYVVLDNAESNDIYFRIFFRYEYFEIIERVIQKRRLRC